MRTIAGGLSRWPCAKDWRRCHRKRSERGRSSVLVSSHAESQGIAENRRAPREHDSTMRCGTREATAHQNHARATATATETTAQKPKKARKSPSPNLPLAPCARAASRISPREGAPMEAPMCDEAGALFSFLLSRVLVSHGKMRADRHLCWSFARDLRNWSPYRAYGAHGPLGVPKATVQAWKLPTKRQNCNIN